MKTSRYIENEGIKVTLNKRRGEQKTGERDRERERERGVRGVNMGLLSFGQADRLAPHQKHST